MKVIELENGCDGKFDEAFALIGEAQKMSSAVAEEMRSSFERCWMQLLYMLHNHELPKDEYGLQQGEYRLMIGPDFVKGSFSFAFFRDGVPDLVGGMILHGLYDGMKAGSTIYWSLHT